MSDSLLPLLPQSDVPHVHGPDCNHGPHVSIGHADTLPISNPVCAAAGDANPKKPKPTSLTILSEPAHVHGPGCGHDHHAPAATGDGHIHGPSCSHGHPPAPHLPANDIHYHGTTPCSHVPTQAINSVAHEAHLPKGKSNTGLWVAGIAVVAGIGAYLINEYGKKPAKKKEIAPSQSGDWQERVGLSDKTEARNL